MPPELVSIELSRPSVARESLSRELLAMVRTKTPSPADVELESNLDEIGVDSLGMAELLFEIESRYGIKSDDRLLELRTVEEVVDYVRARVDDGSRSAAA